MTTKTRDVGVDQETMDRVLCLLARAVERHGLEILAAMIADAEARRRRN